VSGKKENIIMSKKKKIKAKDFLDLLHDMFGDRHEHIGDDWKPKKPKTIKKP
jgi:hypothetical protein